MGRLWAQGQALAHVTSVLADQEVGTHVVCGVAGQITTLYYFRVNGAAANTEMRLWDASGTLIEHVTLASGSQSAQGWQPFALVTPHPVNAGDALTVSVTWKAGSGNEPYDNPISPANAADFPSWYESFNATAGAYPTGSGYQGETRAVDLWLETGTQPATPADVDNSLAEWLSTTDGTHADSAPLQTRTIVGTILTDLGINGIDATRGQGNLLDTIKSVADATKAVADVVQLLLKPTGTGDPSAVRTTAGRTAVQAAIDAEAWGALNNALLVAGYNRSLPPSAGWTLAAERDWADTLAWAVPANCYLVTVTTWPDKQPATSSPAGTWLYRLGWWTVLDGDYSSGREWFEFEKELLYRGGVLMPGVALFTKGGTTGHIQAWTIG